VIFEGYATRVEEWLLTYLAADSGRDTSQNRGLLGPATTIPECSRPAVYVGPGH